MRDAFRATLFCAALSGSPALAAADAPLPSPLDLQQALAYAAEHPSVDLGGTRSPLPEPRAPLMLDCDELAFGTAGDEARNRVGTELVGPAVAQELRILERFVDVLLADLRFSSDNEALAVAYILFDRARARGELGQVSELRVAELEAEYQDVLRQRVASELSQRLTRALLAQALGRSGDLPRDLSEPALPAAPERLPAPAEVAAAAAAGNPWLASLKAGGDPARARLVDMAVAQQAFELLLRLEALDAVGRYARIESGLRELKLEESRTLYEQEVRADLGYSMSQQTRARLREQRVAYCRALTLAELAALQGRPAWPLGKTED
jgi:hypothetical protein